MSERTGDWEARLIAVLKEAAERTFDARAWNCARFAHACAQAVSGRVLPFELKGSLEASVDAVLPRIPTKLATRGDIMLGHVPEPSLGVCIGAQVAFVTLPAGLMTQPRRRMAAAWRV